MNKKRFIPLVAIGALILSLIVVFPAFGVGDAGFIVPSAFEEANDGSLNDATPDDQEYGRQGGEIGLFLEDDDLDVPIRRVLIPELDMSADADSGIAHITAHSNVIYTTANLDVNDYVAVGEYPVRKVTASVKRTAVPAAAAVGPPAVTTANTSRDADDTGNTNNNWYLMLASDGVGSGSVAVAATDDIADIVFSGFKDDEDVTVASDVKPAGAVATSLEGAFGTATVADGDGEVAIAIGEITSAIDTDAVMKDTVYTATITVKGSTDDDDTPTAEKKDTLKIHIYYPTMATLDRHFPTTSASAMEVRLIEIEDETKTLVKWSDNYGLYAQAIELTGTNVSAAGRFNLGDRLVANSNITTTQSFSDDDPQPTGDALDLAEEKKRLSGSTSGRVGVNDAMVVTAAGVSSDASYVRDDLLEPGATAGYLAAWFEEKNHTGSTVTVRSQAFQTKTTLVMQETAPDSGEFALKIEAVAFGTPTYVKDEDGEDTTTVETMRYEEPMVNAMVEDTTNPLPKFPVNPRDVVTLDSSDSRATLPIETTPPTFTGLSPAHNFAGSNTRPTVSGQVTDGDSGLAEGMIDIIFWVDVAGSFSTETVNPKDDADSDDISGGFEVSARLGDDDNDVVPDDDATIYWWIRATDKAGNVGFSDQMPTNDNGTANTCMGQSLDGVANPQSQLEDMGCQPYVILLDNTNPKLDRAETGRHWNSALRTGDSKDKTEYRVTKSDASSVLVIFDESLDATSVSANDFEVNGSTPVDASPYNVTVRDAANAGVTSYAGYDAGLDSVSTVGEKLGYVFLRLSSDLKADAEPKVELVGEVLDLAGNEQDTGVDNDATDRIAPTLTVTLDEGSRPATMDKVNLRITSDENIGTPTVEFVQVMSYDDNAMVTADSDKGMGTVKFVSSTEYTAVVSAGSVADGLYTIHVKATDAAGGNVGMTGDMSGEVDADDDTKAILFEHDENIGDPDVDPNMDGVQDKFSIDDPNTYIRIDFSAEAREYDNMMYDHDMMATTDEIKGDDLDTHAGVTIVSAMLGDMDITDMLQANDVGNVFLYRATDLSLGEHELEVIAMDAAGNKHAVAKKATIEITERKPFSLKLNPGWNLISIPGEPMDSDINVVIPAERTDITSVLAFDPTVPGQWLSATRDADGMLSGTLKNVTATRAYWVETNTFTPLKVMIPKQSAGTARILPTIALAKGWNMVPVLDVDGDFKLNDDMDDNDNTRPATGSDGYFMGLEGVRAYTFNTITNRWELVTEVMIGKGYWVYVTKAGVIVP